MTLSPYTLSLALVGALLLSGCASEVFQRGIALDEDILEAIEPNVVERNEVLRLLGPPSVTALEAERAWIYISWTTQSYEPFAPQELDRQIVVVNFDDAGRVSAVHRYGPEDGKEIAYASIITPPPGDDPSWLGLILGNIGRIIPAGIPSE